MKIIERQLKLIPRPHRYLFLSSQLDIFYQLLDNILQLSVLLNQRCRTIVHLFDYLFAGLLEETCQVIKGERLAETCTYTVDEVEGFAEIGFEEGRILPVIVDYFLVLLDYVGFGILFSQALRINNIFRYNLDIAGSHRFLLLIIQEIPLDPLQLILKLKILLQFHS